MSALNRFDVASLASHQVAQLGARLRCIADGTPASFGRIAAGMVDLLDDALRDGNGRPALALARAYRTARLGDHAAEPLADAREAAPGEAIAPDGRCLLLVATRGREPAWNDLTRADLDRVIPLGAEAAARMPLLGELAAQLLGPHGADDDRATVRHVADAREDPSPSAQRDLARRHGVRSILAFGAALPDAEAFVVLLGAAVAIDEAVARSFEMLALHARLAFLGATDLGPSLSEEVVLRARVATLDRLLRYQEDEAARHATILHADLGAERRRAEDLSRQRSTEQRAQTERLERTQRAMLNVIDDLRAARSLLERRVGERTAELEHANLELQKSNRELEEFAYVASHDLQEPLRTIVGYLQLIESRYRHELVGEGHEFIDFAISGAERMQALIDGLLSYSRVTTKVRPFEKVALGAVLDDVLASLAAAIERSGARIERDDLPVVLGDRVQLGQVFQNLLSNALKFSGDEPPRVEVRCARVDAAWRIMVRDRGIGFDDKHADSVFRVFRRLQRKYPGTGIGLAICKKVVERHGGEIHAQARVGQGATFTFTLPYTEVRL